jgi:hypothetical protein
MATTKIRSSSITDGQVANADLSATVAVTGGQIADDAITTAKILDNNVTLDKMAGGTDGNLITYDASGDPAYVATGAATNILTSNGAGAAPTFQAAAAGGLTTASQWRLTGDFTGDAVPIGDSTGVLEVCDTNGYVNLGTGMTYSSGVFTFPAGGTGWWYLLGQFTINTAANASAAGLLEYTADDGGAWTTASTSGTSNYYAFRGNINIHHLLKITDLTNQKVRWSMDADPAGHGGVVTTRGNTDITETGFTFIKLA